MLAMPDDIPLIITSNMLAEELATLVLITVVVAMDPPMLDVNVLDELVSVLLVLRLVTDRLVVVALEANKLLLLELVKVELTPDKFVMYALVIVAFPNIGLSVNMYVTLPAVSVATVRLELVEDARKL